MEKLRKEIDLIDRQIAELLDRRMRLAYEIGLYKKEKNFSLIHPDREKGIYEKLSQLDLKTIYPEELREIYHLIIEIGRRYGARALNE